MHEYELSGERVRWDSKPAVDPLLAEVALLMQVRTPEGEFPPEAIDAIFDNGVCENYESVVPNGVSKIEQQLVAGDYVWMGMGSVENARNGHAYHKHEFAHQRVDAEEDEAIDVLENLVPGRIKVTISPRAAGTIDASFEEAKDEGLHDRDLIRTQYLKTDDEGNITGKVTESIQVFDVPLYAWVALEESAELFEEPIAVEPPNSALAVLKTHRQNHVPAERLTEGVVGVLKAVRKYVIEPEIQTSIDRQLQKFDVDQEDMRQKIEDVTHERAAFLCHLTNSLHDGRATDYINQYIDVHKGQFGGQQKILVDHMRRSDGGYNMNEAFARICSGVNKTIVAVRAAVEAENQEVITKIKNPNLVDRIHQENIFFAHNNVGWEAQLRMQQVSNQAIATSGIRPSGGCSPDMGDIFGSADTTKKLEGDAKDAFGDSNSEESYDFDKEMYCVVCQAPPGDDEPKKMCGPCGICKGCDTKIRAKSAAA